MDNHYITLENREKITISQVVDVDAFDEDNLFTAKKQRGIPRILFMQTAINTVFSTVSHISEHVPKGI